MRQQLGGELRGELVGGLQRNRGLPLNIAEYTTKCRSCAR